MSGRHPVQTPPAPPLAPLGNFSSIYNVLLHDKTEVVFAVHMLFKYVPMDEIVEFMKNSGCLVTKYPDTPVVDFVCKAFRWMNMTGRTKYFLTRLEEYCDRKGRKLEYKADYFAEITQYDDYHGFC